MSHGTNHIYPSTLDISETTPVETLEAYAYLLSECRFPAQVSPETSLRPVVRDVSRALSLLRAELLRRLSASAPSDRPAALAALFALSPQLPSRAAALCHSIASSWDGFSSSRPILISVLASLSSPSCPDPLSLKRRLSRWISTRLASPDLLLFEIASRFLRICGRHPRRRAILESFASYLTSTPLSNLPALHLIRLHALAPLWYEMRRHLNLPTFTRLFQRDIAQALRDAAPGSALEAILTLTERSEALNHARLIGLREPSNTPLGLIEIPADATPLYLTQAIEGCSRPLTWTSRENLTKIADFVQTVILSRDLSSSHLHLLTSLLLALSKAPRTTSSSPSQPRVDYPLLVNTLAKTVTRLAHRTDTPHLTLALPYSALAEATGIGAYRARFEQILRRCYTTLADHRHYPSLGLDPTDPESLSFTLSLLNANIPTLRLLSPRYDPSRLPSNIAYQSQ